MKLENSINKMTVTPEYDPSLTNDLNGKSSQILAIVIISTLIQTRFKLS